MKKRTRERKRVVASDVRRAAWCPLGEEREKAPCVTYYYIAAAVQMGGAAAAVHLCARGGHRRALSPSPHSAEMLICTRTPTSNPPQPLRATPNRIYSETAWQKRK